MNMNVTSSKPTQSVSSTAATSAPSRSESSSKATETKSSTPSASPSKFKSSQPATQSESSRVESNLQAASSAGLCQMSQLMQQQAAQAQNTQNTTAAQNQARDIGQSLKDLKLNFKPSNNKIEYDAQGNIKSDIKDLMMMKYNPLASSSAREESNRFRIHCAGKEFSTENTRFIDDAKKLSKMDPNSPQFDKHLKFLHKNYQSERSQEVSLNLSYGHRGHCEETYNRFTQAETNYKNNQTPENKKALDDARCAMVDTVHSSVNQTFSLMKDQYYRYAAKSGREGLTAVTNQTIGKHFAQDVGTMWNNWRRGENKPDFNTRHKSDIAAVRNYYQGLQSRKTYADYGL